MRQRSMSDFHYTTISGENRHGTLSVYDNANDFEKLRQSILSGFDSKNNDLLIVLISSTIIIVTCRILVSI